MTTPNNEFEDTNIIKDSPHIHRSAEIKSEIEDCYRQISDAKFRISEIRKLCKHTNISQGLWSWREGSCRDAVICDACGGLIKFID